MSNQRNGDNDQKYEGVHRSTKSVDWKDLNFLKFVSELGHTLSVSDKKILRRHIDEGANLEGIEAADIDIDPELDEMYDGVHQLTAETPLTWAIIAGNIDAVKMLLDLGADVDTPNSDELTPLELAIELENLELVKLLVKYGAILDEPMEYIRWLEERKGNKKIAAILYKMIINRVEQRGGYYL